MDSPGISLLDLSNAARAIGMRTLAVHMDFKLLERVAKLPCIAYWEKSHYIVVYRIEKHKIYVADPRDGLLEHSKKQFIKGWINRAARGYILMLEPSPAFFEGIERESYK
jgi:ATP-binding cassette subfamily B protein